MFLHDYALRKVTYSAEVRIHWLYPLQWVKNPHLFLEKGVLSMTLNGIWSFCAGDLGSVVYPYITITSRLTLTWSGSTCYDSI